MELYWHYFLSTPKIGNNLFYNKVADCGEIGSKECSVLIIRKSHKSSWKNYFRHIYTSPCSKPWTEAVFHENAQVSIFNFNANITNHLFFRSPTSCKSSTDGVTSWFLRVYVLIMTVGFLLQPVFFLFIRSY